MSPSTRQSARRRRYLTAVLLLGVSACSRTRAASASAPGAELVGVVGAWATANDAGPVFTVDGTAWSGQTDSTTVAAASARFFGVPASQSLLRNWTAATAFPLAIAPTPTSVSDGVIRVQFKLVGGASDQNAGIVFALAPSGEYLYARYNTKDGDLALWRYANAERTVIAHGAGTAKLPLGQWHELVLTVQGRRIDAAISGAPSVTLSHTLDSNPSGRVGVWVKRDAVTSFKSFRVTR